MIALVCLWAFTLGQAWLCPSAVWCHDADTGIVHFEIACGGGDDLCCAKAVGHDAADVHREGGEIDAGSGCTDVAAVHEAMQVDRAELRLMAAAPAPVFGDASLLFEPLFRLHATRVAAPRPEPPGHAPRPADPLGLIESVIIVV